MLNPMLSRKYNTIMYQKLISGVTVLMSPCNISFPRVIASCDDINLMLDMATTVRRQGNGYGSRIEFRLRLRLHGEEG